MDANTKEKQIFESFSKLTELIDHIKENSGKIEAHQMEQNIFHGVMELGRTLMDYSFATMESKDSGQKISCGDVALKHHGQRTRDYYSIFGKIRIARSCYWEKGSQLQFPLDKQCNLPANSFSYFLQEIVNSICITDSFSESKKKLKRFFNLTIHEQQLEQLNRKSITDYDQYYEQKPVPDKDTEGEIQVLSFDGKGVPMIKKEAAKIIARKGKGEKQQKKKEALVGISYTVDKIERTSKEVAANLIYPENKKESENSNVKALNIRRMASIAKSKEQVMEEIISDSLKRNPDNEKDVVVLIDGARSLEKKIKSLLDNKIQNYTVVLDIIHVLEYIYIAGNVLYDENSKKLKDYVYNQLLSILEGKTGRVIGGMKQTITKQKLRGHKLKAMEKVITYFTNHIQIMNYDQYLAKGYPIATGVVESACKLLVKDRMEGCGMRWSIEGAEAMLLLRSIDKSSDWENYQNFHIKQEGNRLFNKKCLEKSAA